MHDRIRDLLSERMNAPLAAAEEAEVSAHLESCAGCRAVARDFASQRAALRSLPSPQPPRDLWARTSAALDHETTRRTLPLPSRRPVRVGRAAVATGLSVLAVGLVVALPLADIGPGGTLTARATPYAIVPDDLVLAAQSATGVDIGRTRVDVVCPAERSDCSTGGTSESVARLRGFQGLDNFVVDPDGQLAVLSGVDESGHARYEIVVIDPPADTASPEVAPPTQAPEANPTPSATASSRATRDGGSPTPTVTASASGAPTVTPSPDGTPDVTPSDTAPPTDALPTFAISPPPSPSAEPATQSQSGPILGGVIAAGMPAMWSPDGSALAFSARPADGTRGPDIYIWRPGEATASPVTDDGASYFSSWAGDRIVASRARPTAGNPARFSRLEVESFVLDPETGERRPLRAPDVWLPVVDPTGRHAVAWRGELAMASRVTVPASGRLYLESWLEQDPFGDFDGTDADADAEATPIPSTASSPDADGRPLDPGGIGLASVREWEVRWQSDGTAFGVWVAGEPGATAGRLAIVAIEEREGDEPAIDVVVGPEEAWRAFSVGNDRVAYVSPADGGDEGELRVATWGAAGSGSIRIRDVKRGEMLPAF